jgi:FtsP/CotA-like multicopper oxidase with cupredoxin domain
VDIQKITQAMNLTFSRRSFLRTLGAGGALLVGGGLSACAVPPSGVAAPATGPTPRGPSGGFSPDLEINLRAAAGNAQILPGKSTAVWGYQASLARGDASSLLTLKDNYLGPIIRAKKGQRVRVNFKNDLPAGHPSIVHWHGLTLPEDMDGHPRFAVQPGQSYVYEFEVIDRAGPYWFHPHPHEQTGVQVYNGLAGMFLVSDPEEAAAGLPTGAFDVPLIIQDRAFDASNQFAYLGGAGSMPASPSAPAGGMPGHNMAGMGGSMGGSATPAPGGMMGGMQGAMDQMMGFLGTRVLINGKPDYSLSAATRAYRLRLLNGSNARIYKLGWSDGSPIIVIGSDGGLLEKPVEKPYVMLAPGERVEVWADFSRFKLGAEITLQSLKFEGADDHGGMMGGMMSSGAPDQGTPMTLLKVKVEREEKETLSLPRTLSSITRLQAEQAVNAAAPRQIALTLNGMQWLINNRTFEMDSALPEETVKLGTTEVWEIVNKLNPGQMMDANGMAHPMHIHGGQFQVLSREVLPQLKAGWDSVREGRVDEGWKDTVLVMPGETVKLAMKFERYKGLFVYHCHNLEHESSGMMRNYRVA